MKRYSFLTAVLIVLILPAVCFGDSLISVPCSADHFGLLHRQITQALSRVTETLEPAWSVTPGGNADYTQAGNILVPPANDNFASRGHLIGALGLVMVDDTEATFEAGEPFHFPYGFGQNTIWYSWTAPYSGTFGFDTVNSVVPTFLKVYQGSSLTSLTPAPTSGYPFYSSINAQNGAVYQIAVMGASAANKGITHLRYYPDSIGGNTNFFIITANIPLMVPAPDGSIAYTVTKIMASISSPTNRYGYLVNPKLEYEFYPEGLNIYDRKNTGVVLNAHPADAGTQYMLLDYDGKQVLLYNQITQKALLYRLTKQGLTKVGEAVVPYVMEGKLQGSYIYINQGLTEGFYIIQASTGVKAYDKRLKKLKWQLPYEKGSIDIHVNTGFAYRHITGPYTQEIIGYKKGTEHYRTQLDYSLTGTTQIQTDPIGNIVYWYVHGPHPFRTNSPLTYISRKGEELFSNQTLPGAGNAWAFGGFEKTRMYIVRPNGTEQIAAGYKFSKTIMQTGNLPLTGFGDAELNDGQLTVYRRAGTDTQGFIQYDKNIKKETWNEPASLGSVEYIGKGTFGRMQVVPGSGSTNYILQIFNRKKKFSDHQITL